MFKKIIAFGIFSILFQCAAMAKCCVSGIGAYIIKDPYNKKVFVFKTFPDSMAQKYNLKDGSEIIKVDDIKVKKLQTAQVSSLIRGEKGTNVKLLVKYNNKKSIYTIPRDIYVFQDDEINELESVWRKIVPQNVIVEPFPQNIIKNMSKEWYEEIIPTANYWADRKENFKTDYNSCSSNPEKESCINNLIEKEKAKTNEDKEKGVKL